MDVDKLEAGWETDALVAEKVMGWKHITHFNQSPIADGWIGFWDGEWPQWVKRPDEDNVWQPSTDITAAWEVVEKLEYNWSLGRDVGQCSDDYETSGDKLYRFVYSAPGMPMQGISANTAPLAICRAVLKAIQNER